MMIKTWQRHLLTYEFAGQSRPKLGTYQKELPPNVGESCRGRLQIDEIGNGDGGNCERDTFGAEVVGEDLAVKDYAGYIDAAAVEKQEDVAV